MFILILEGTGNLINRKQGINRETVKAATPVQKTGGGEWFLRVDHQVVIYIFV